MIWITYVPEAANNDMGFHTFCFYISLFYWYLPGASLGNLVLKMIDIPKHLGFHPHFQKLYPNFHGVLFSSLKKMKSEVILLFTGEKGGWIFRQNPPSPSSPFIHHIPRGQLSGWGHGFSTKKLVGFKPPMFMNKNHHANRNLHHQPTHHRSQPLGSDPTGWSLRKYGDFCQHFCGGLASWVASKKYHTSRCVPWSHQNKWWRKIAKKA